jgi:CRP-like cAMP-binding protein
VCGAVAARKDVMEALASVPLFSRCTKRDLAIVARHIELVDLPAGRAVVTEGEEGDAFYVLLAGTVHVSRDGVARGERGPGNHFGELALLDPAPRAATVTTASDVTVGVLGRRMFRVLVRDVPTLNERLLASLAAQLRDATAPD